MGLTVIEMPGRAGHDGSGSASAASFLLQSAKASISGKAMTFRPASTESRFRLSWDLPPVASQR